MLPWIHMHILPSSQVVPCCVWPYSGPVGNAKNESLKAIWNNDQYTEIRQKMLKNEPVAGCDQCYQRDSANGHSLRKTSNKTYGHLFDEVVAPSADDGKLRKFKLSYFDIRFSNICNFKCRGCSPELSSSWLADHEKLFNYKSEKDRLISITPNVTLWEELLGFLPDVEEAYFAGGEPLIMDEHYLILEELIRLEKTDVTLSYNSNMSNLRFRDKFVTEYWNKFKKVFVGVSLDDFGPRGEYFRHGMDWKKTVENIRHVQEKCNNVFFAESCTVGLHNIFYLPELHTELVKENIISLPGNFYVNLIVDPIEYTAQVLPKSFKEKVTKKLQDYIAVVATNIEMHDWQYEFLKGQFESAINFMNQQDMSHLLPEFRKRTRSLDAIRIENFVNVYPELAFLMED